ncbi:MULTISPECIES: DMT family transporter [Pseudomonas]|uniref:DMT family transporter n=1 Tax=Pseudomonadaceae TaxID=135621 RepID=UPI0004232687|nr:MULTISPECIES: DMT family transporter [Pseudomonas]MDE3735224.1 DMT family transporter [Pseudomonas resinovorans]
MSAQSHLPQRIDQPLKGIVLVCLATFLFSSHDAISKYLSAFYPIVMVVWVRYLVHTLLMAGYLLPREGGRVLRTKRPLLQVVRALCLIGVSLLFTTGLRYIPLAEATSVIFLAPLLVTALSVPLLRERVSRGQWAAVLVGFGGVLLIVRPGGALFTPAILLPLAAAVCFAFYQLTTRILSRSDSAATTNFITGLTNTLIMSALVPFFWHLPDSLGHSLLMLALGACGMGGHMLLTQAFRHASPPLLAPFGYGQIVFAGLLGLLLFNHAPDQVGLLGIAIIVGSGLFMAYAQKR